MTSVAHDPYPGVIIPWFKDVTSLHMLQVQVRTSLGMLQVRVCYKFSVSGDSFMELTRMLYIDLLALAKCQV